MPRKQMCIDCKKICFPKIKKSNPRCHSCFTIFNRKDKLSTQEYRRNWAMKKKYGIDLEFFEFHWFAFRGICNICNIQMKLPESKRGQSLDVVAIDHDHNTGLFRGLICNGCNKGLGLFKDNTDILEKAKEYLNGT